MAMTTWDAGDIVDQSGRTFVVTGANSGLGAEAAKALVKAGAHVILACRNVDKGKAVAAPLGERAEVRRLDLADLASVREFADSVDAVDVLVNNAGVMAVPLGRTADGFEMQFGTNHLGHFALTGLLLGKVTDRVVTMSSTMHKIGSIDLDDLNWERRTYRRWPAYGQSKLANLLFTYELQRKLSASGSQVRALASHPGYAATNLQSHTESISSRVMALANPFIAQSAKMGALPMLYAATVPDAIGGSYLGPSSMFETRGYPKVVSSNRKSHDRSVARQLWSASEQLTGVTYDFGG
ncbi:SDR family NAD(P)-dependent oxidoreductase [Rhodococcus hoagii]|uniref:Oxidoreductase, short chain dehydrogenase/reductase family protein n=4 Tax=Nocardiaceae TaxID=85025 RepID=E9T1T0_RHOHA|nr:oxidoreductase, short chain dehydrogenase/reductase family protein [Prescottella equi ATCC 33707]MBM4468133.1 SDR family NAD(P)-dependent oxidoreductase [Prescottella equi]CBH47002.1 short chain dehydrogenase [Prescottella equi 103S]MBM4477559.1 SDR family NAD(P)-dependent oxidoreductase [Prescottella equi]MBM4482648.1 SDR family NAD(P)-dependent oxidoreductase [Prescottella equi]